MEPGEVVLYAAGMMSALLIKQAMEQESLGPKMGLDCRPGGSECNVTSASVAPAAPAAAKTSTSPTASESGTTLAQAQHPARPGLVAAANSTQHPIQRLTHNIRTEFEANGVRDAAANKRRY